MDDKTRLLLQGYLNEVRQLPNEAAKTHCFAGLVSALFPGSTASTELAQGIEKLVRIDTPEGLRRRKIDAYHGNAVIEFEKSLKATEQTALIQLREQASGVWRGEKGERRPLLCIASDGVVWKTFRPIVKAGAPAKPRPDDIELEELRTLTLSNDTLSDFWVWLTSLLFRRDRLEPTAERFRVDFGATSPAFAHALDATRRAWEIGKKKIPEVQVAFDTWKRYLTITYGALGNDLDTLFLKHTYLASVARLLIWAALSRGKTSSSLRETATEVLSGEYFRSQRIENLVEDDFFQWVRHPAADAILSPIWERLLAQMLDYDLAHLSQDILKAVYQELVDPKDRHDLGEYYTPDWLCERIVEDVLPPSGFVSVLDPTCGSGSFLRAAIAHQLKANPNGGDVKRLRSILDSVVGIDIHPLAVTIARATYALAVRSLITSSKRPVQIPVYLADSLFLPSEVRQLSLGKAPSYEIRFGGNRKVEIPDELVRAPEMFDPAVAACAKVAQDHAKSGRENLRTLKAYLANAVPTVSSHRQFEQMLSALWTFTSELADLIKQHRNSIWAFVVRNAYRPAMMRDRFDYIIGNPPWLSYRYISDPDYQAEVKRRAVEEYRIAPRSQKLMTQMELATVFLVHALSTFGKDGATLAFVMPRSVFSADQHHNVRVRQYRAPVRVYQYYDLREVFPVFNVPSCVLFAQKEAVRTAASYRLTALEWRGVLPGRDLSWHEAAPRLEVAKKTARVIYLATRSAISTGAGPTTPHPSGPYSKRFRQGATLVPRNFYFVRVPSLAGKPDPEALYWAETDPEQAREAKEPYKDVAFQGQVEGRFLFSTALSRHLLPFAITALPTLVLPIEFSAEGPVAGQPTMRKARDLIEAGYRDFAHWMEEAERVWTEKRGRKAESQSVYERLDYQRELTGQNLKHAILVLYNAAGTNVCAATIDRRALSLPFVVEHKLYWYAAANQETADYLAAVLNSNIVNDIIKPFQSLGLMGERDIEKKVLDLPIPLYNADRALHGRLSKLGTRAAAEAGGYLTSEFLPNGLGARRAEVRKAIAEIMDEIDDAVRTLLGTVSDEEVAEAADS